MALAPVAGRLEAGVKLTNPAVIVLGTEGAMDFVQTGCSETNANFTWNFSTGPLRTGLVVYWTIIFAGSSAFLLGLSELFLLRLRA
ncbi:predicted protein [Histoplasma mississippiense (nom. inval.)]|uniref:predicted protein n=1 Tax=Ajellomyces capsulatus (strain NAm1 / WU24) TaxID=2059318 RepID=UPI000157C42C|nr:predicted protein [Histoplasma mississippiense (nom. inval.)]EDN07746.1 predicted protein [Histoplasma mississippiense (nom. inval.)]